MKSGLWTVAVATVVLFAVAGGCVPLDQYKQMQMDNRTLQGEKAQLEQELYDARSNMDNLRTRLSACEAQLADKTTLANNLQAENDTLEAAFKKCQDTLEQFAGRQLPGEAIYIKLPPELDSALKDFAAKYPDLVQYDPKTGTVKWKADLVFPFASDAIGDKAKEALKSFADIMNSAAAANFDLFIVGHTDDRPIVNEATRKMHPTNWHLSAHRAIAVSDGLQSVGVAPQRIGVAGYSEYRPVVPGPSKMGVGEERNRRVEIYVVPAGSIGGVPASKVGAGPEPRVAPPSEKPAAPAEKPAAPKDKAPAPKEPTGDNVK